MHHTASQGAIVAASLRKYGLGGAIADVLGGDLGIGKAERIASLQFRFAFASRDTLMTGDAISDIREGKRAGVRTAAVAWGYQDLALLAGENPDFVVRQPRDLLKLAAALAGA
jgi:phosphoglycolate phosphatase